MQLTKLLGIDKPVIQAPMAGAQDWELAVAVSESGGLGSIPCGMLNEHQVIEQITQFKKRSSKPYNLNFFCHEMPALDSQALRTWQNKLQPYYDALGINPSAEIKGLRLPFSQQMADVLEPHSPPIISFHFGLPSPDLVAQVKSWGTIILSSATTVKEAIWLQDNGVDIVIAQGSEAGGHRGLFLTSDLSSQLPTSELVSKLTERINLPIVAAGGIANSNDVEKVIDLGAAGVQVGTSYLLCDEAKTSKVHRQALKNQSLKTEITNVFSGRPARGICNKVMIDLGFMSEYAPRFPYASIALVPLRSKAEANNSGDFSPLWSGENRIGCQEISAKELTKQLWNCA